MRIDGFRSPMITTTKIAWLAVVSLFIGWLLPGAGAENTGSDTQVVLLGVGNPNADPERSGPAVAVVTNGVAYLVDCGPGVVRRAAAAEKKGVEALGATKLERVFITHLHSDHTLGYPDLIFTPWVLGRTEPLEAYGPKGLREMTANIEKAWKKDIYVRTHGLEEANRRGYKVTVHEIAPGLVYRDANVTVTAFLVHHGIWDQAFGYRFDTKDRSVVVSGDTKPVDSLVEACHGCDVLLHEVYNPRGEELKTEHWKKYFSDFHTSPEELADVARRAHPKLLVLYHLSMEKLPEEDLVEQVRKAYGGKMLVGRDLDIY